MHEYDNACWIENGYEHRLEPAQPLHCQRCLVFLLLVRDAATVESPFFILFGEVIWVISRCEAFSSYGLRSVIVIVIVGILHCHNSFGRGSRRRRRFQRRALLPQSHLLEHLGRWCIWHAPFVSTCRNFWYLKVGSIYTRKDAVCRRGTLKSLSISMARCKLELALTRCPPGYH